MTCTPSTRRVHPTHWSNTGAESASIVASVRDIADFAAGDERRTAKFPNATHKFIQPHALDGGPVLYVGSPHMVVEGLETQEAGRDLLTMVLTHATRRRSRTSTPGTRATSSSGTTRRRSTTRCPTTAPRRTSCASSTGRRRAHGRRCCSGVDGVEADTTSRRSASLAWDSGDVVVWAGRSTFGFLC